MALQTVSLTSPIIVEATTASDFKNKVETMLLAAPEWVARHVQMVRMYLNEVKEIDREGYIYKPKYTHSDLKMEFECSYKKYRLTFIQEDPLPDFIKQMLNGFRDQSSTPPPRNPSKPEIKQEDRQEQHTLHSDVRYHGPITQESLKLVPQKVAGLTSRYAKSTFPYQLTVEAGGVTVSGTYQTVGKKFNFADYMKEKGETGISFEDWAKKQ